MAITLGSDPEFMLQKDGKFFSAIPIVPGTKYNRYNTGRHQVYYDNVMAECAVAPAESKKEFITNIQDCLQRYAAIVKPYILVAQASAEYPKKELATPEAQQIGCDPEFCAYDLGPAEPPVEAFRKNTLRTAGGHVHLGTQLGKQTFGCLAIVRMCDLFLGTTSIFLDKDKTAKYRRKLYGKAGRFRQPAWGVEYRSLGNFWLTSPKLVGLVFDLCAFVVDFVEQNQHEKLWNVDYDRLNNDESWNEEGFHPSQCHHCTGYDVGELRQAIEDMDQRKGSKFLTFIAQFLPKSLYNEIVKLSKSGPYDLYQEWNLK